MSSVTRPPCPAVPPSGRSYIALTRSTPGSVSSGPTIPETKSEENSFRSASMKQTMSPLVTRRNATAPRPCRARSGCAAGSRPGAPRARPPRRPPARCGRSSPSRRRRSRRRGHLLHQVVADDGDDLADRLLLVQRGQDDAHRGARGPFGGHESVERAIGHGPGAIAQPALSFLQHSLRLLTV